MAGRNTLIWVAAFIILIAAGLFVFRDYVQSAVLSVGTDFTDASGVDPAQFLVYRDESGFEIRYPQTMQANYPSQYGEIKIFFSASDEQGNTELYQVGVSNSSVDFVRSQIASQMGSDEKSTLVESQQGNVHFMRFNAKTDLVSMTIEYAIYQCSAGKTGVFTAFIPQSRQDDLKVANYMASTFKCGALGN